MSLITIPRKDPDDELTNEEFNQLLDTLKDAIKGIKTLDIQSSTGTFTGVVNFLSDVIIGGEPGPYAKFWEGMNIIYVGKHGGAYDGANYDGKSPSKAISTFQDAIDNVELIHGSVPTEANPCGIFCVDGGVYEEGIVTKDYCSIKAPLAVLKLNNTQLIVNNVDCHFLDIIRTTGSGDAITLSGTTGSSHIIADVIVDFGTGTTIAQTSTKVGYINVNRLDVEGGGIGISDDNTTSSHIHCRIQSLRLRSNGAIGISKNRPGSIHGFIDGIGPAGSGATGTTAIKSTNGSISLSIIDLQGDTAYSAINPAVLNIYSNSLTGTEIKSSQTSIVTPALLKVAIDDITNKEDSLGNPAYDGFVLSSTVAGVRSWVLTGDMNTLIYDPTTANGDAFDIENFHGRQLDFDIDAVVSSYQEGRLSWNNDENTLNIDTGVGNTTIQVGQESVIRIHNATASPLINGKVIYVTDTFTNGVPNCELAIASNVKHLSTLIGVTTATINPGEDGFATTNGIVRGIDLSGVSEGIAYLSDTTPGEITNTPPEFPSYVIEIAGVLDAVIDGRMFVDIVGGEDKTLNNAWNGTVRETLNFFVSSDTVTITGSLEQSGGSGGDLTLRFSDGIYVLDCTPTATIVLTPGTNAVPVKNFVYVPKSTKVLTVSTSDWPAEEHCRIADVVLQSASYTNLYGALANRNWNDHVQGLEGMGEMSHIGQWIRNRPASWYSGAQATLAEISPSTIYYSNTAGKVFQKHLQDFGVKNQGAGDKLFVPNDSLGAYSVCTDICDYLLDSTGDTMATNYFNFVFWGVCTKSSQPDQVMMNLPSGSYASLEGAIIDLSGYDDYTIPSIYNGTGFLIARFTISHKNPGTWQVEDYTDLRGTISTSSVSGGGGGGVATSFTSLTDTPASYIGQAGNVPVVNGSETTLEFINGVNGVFTTNDGKTVTVTNGIITNIV